MKAFRSASLEEEQSQIKEELSYSKGYKKSPEILVLSDSRVANVEHKIDHLPNNLTYLTIIIKKTVLKDTLIHTRTGTALATSARSLGMGLIGSPITHIGTQGTRALGI